MKHARNFVTNAVIGGLLVVLPIYLAILLLLKAMQSVAGLVRPIAKMLPEWLPAENLLALLAVLVISFLSAPPCVPGRGEPSGSASRFRSLKNCLVTP